MALPEIDRLRVEHLLTEFCERRVPVDVRDQVKLGFRIRGNKVLIFESRPVYDDPSRWVEIKVAQLEFDPGSKDWTLYCFDRNSRRMPYFDADPERDSAKHIAEIDADPTCIFWG